MNTAEPLDPVVRLRVLAAALPGAVLAERRLAVGFEQVWQIVTDLETMGPRYESHVDAIKIVEREGDRTRVIATLRGGRVEEMDVRILPGWCLMQSDNSVVAFGGRPEGEKTVLAHVEHDRRSPKGDARLHEAAHARLVRELDTIGALAQALAIPTPEESGQK